MFRGFFVDHYWKNMSPLFIWNPFFIRWPSYFLFEIPHALRKSCWLISHFLLWILLNVTNVEWCSVCMDWHKSFLFHLWIKWKCYWCWIFYFDLIWTNWNFSFDLTKKKLTIMFDLTNEWILLKIQFECLTFVFIGNISKKYLFYFSFHKNCFLQEKVSCMHYFELSVNKTSKKERSSSVIKLWKFYPITCA